MIVIVSYFHPSLFFRVESNLNILNLWDWCVCVCVFTCVCLGGNFQFQFNKEKKEKSFSGKCKTRPTVFNPFSQTIKRNSFFVPSTTPQHSAEWHSAEWHRVEPHLAECHWVEPHLAEWHSTQKHSLKATLRKVWNLQNYTR